MHIKLYPPLNQQKNFVDIELGEAITVFQMLQLLRKETSYIKLLVPGEVSEEIVLNQILVVVNGKVAHLKDPITNQDEVGLFVPVIGG